jgi:hypothetical protein
MTSQNLLIMNREQLRKTLGEINSTIVEGILPPLDGGILRIYQLSNLLGALLESVHFKRETDFLRLTKVIADKVDSIKEGSSISGLKNPLSTVTHYLSGVIEDLEYKGEAQRTWMFQQFVSLIDALRTSGWESTMDASVMIWRDAGYYRHFPKNFKFVCSCGTEGNNFEISFTRKDLASTLFHFTSAIGLLGILELGYNYEENPLGHKFFIKTNRYTKKEVLSDIGPGGFLYCDIVFSKPLETMESVRDIHRRHKMVGPSERRYGACSISFTLEYEVKLKDQYHLRKLGTKSHKKKWSQYILIERKNKQIDESVWKVVDEVSKKVYSVDAMITPTDDTVLWNLKYCDNCMSWSHPTLVFSEPLRLDKIGCHFDVHRCDASKRCLECRIALEKKGRVRARKVAPTGELGDFLNLQIPLEGDATWESLIVKIEKEEKLTSKGKTIVKKVEKLTSKIKPDVSLYVFAMSVPYQQRGRLKTMQEQKQIFTIADQFEKIERFWDAEGDFHYVDWTTDFRLSTDDV